jgi:hypothetical protein
MRCYVAILALALASAITGCRTGQSNVEPFDITETTLARFDGSPLALEDIRMTRSDAEYVADTVYHLEKELLEPWIEHRRGDAILNAVRRNFPTETHIAAHAWSRAEPPQRTGRRAIFTEYGLYATDAPSGMIASISPSTLEAYVNLMLSQHNDDNPQGLMLATWRRFSPATVERRPDMLAAAWQFDLNHDGTPSVILAESMLGPHSRSRLGRPPTDPFPPMRDSVDGYQGNLIALDLLAPGAPSPMLEAIDRLAAGGHVRLLSGPAEMPDADDMHFLRVVLRGLQRGASDVAHVPAGTTRVTAVFSYLMDQAEARALLALDRDDDGGWTLIRFEYQPAAAALTGNEGATVDVMPLLRGAFARR